MIDLIPQKEPMVMVSYLKNGSMCLEIKEDNIFLDDGIFQEAGILEHIAQSVILYFYSKESFISTQPRIGKISNSKFEKTVLKGNILETKVNILFQDENVIDIEATTFVNNEKVAFSEMLLVL
jgi:3-hydroxymyristoyl/3-hydroxydecanoyl-(acyl carrier protein) dehydratase